MTQPITVNRRGRSKRLGIEVRVTRVSYREVSDMALDKTFSGPCPVAVSPTLPTRAGEGALTQ